MQRVPHLPAGLAHYLIRAFGACVAVERVILYGSRARGDHRERSDIDLAVSIPDDSRRGWMEALDVAEEAPTLLRIDMIRLEEAPEDWRRQIEETGIVIYERSATIAAAVSEAVEPAGTAD